MIGLTKNENDIAVSMLLDDEVATRVPLHRRYHHRHKSNKINVIVRKLSEYGYIKFSHQNTIHAGFFHQKRLRELYNIYKVTTAGREYAKRSGAVEIT